MRPRRPKKSTGQYADLGLQLGDQSGYELSLKEQVEQLQALTAGNSVVSTNLSTAQSRAVLDSTSAQTTINGSDVLDAERQFRRAAADYRPDRACRR